MIFLAHIVYYYKEGKVQHWSIESVEAENKDDAHKKVDVFLKEKWPDLRVEKITIKETIR